MFSTNIGRLTFPSPKRTAKSDVLSNDVVIYVFDELRGIFTLLTVGLTRFRAPWGIFLGERIKFSISTRFVRKHGLYHFQNIEFTTLRRNAGKGTLKSRLFCFEARNINTQHTGRNTAGASLPCTRTCTTGHTSTKHQQQTPDWRLAWEAKGMLGSGSLKLGQESSSERGRSGDALSGTQNNHARQSH